MLESVSIIGYLLILAKFTTTRLHLKLTRRLIFLTFLRNARFDRRKGISVNPLEDFGVALGAGVSTQSQVGLDFRDSNDNTLDGNEMTYVSCSN